MAIETLSVELKYGEWMMEKNKKLLSKSKTIAVNMFTIVVGGFIIYQCFHIDDVRSKTVYLDRVLNTYHNYFYFFINFDSDNVLPLELPNGIMNLGDEKIDLSSADPFDVKKRGLEQKKIVVKFPDLNGDIQDFTFTGNPLKYIRLNDYCCVIYSYGPDRDKDLEEFDSERVLSYIENSVDVERYELEQGEGILGKYAYNWSNGEKSSGDIIVYFNFNEK